MTKELNFNELYGNEFSLSELMVEREKISTEDIVKYHPDKISINAVDKVEIDGEEVYVYTFTEEPKHFAFAGFVLKKFFDKVYDNYKPEELNEALRVHPFTVRLVQGRTNDNKPITKIEKV